jgi:ribosomal-protein-alanine N-acetyltransferase
MNYTFRKMTLEDLEQVVAIDQVSFSLPWPARSFSFEYDNPVSRCWVADLNSRVIAIVVGWFFVDEIHIATLATHPDFRRQGIGKNLLLHALSFAKEEGAQSAFLEVREGNLAAIEMYRQFGFIENGRRSGYYADNHEDAILMLLESLPGE